MSERVRGWVQVCDEGVTEREGVNNERLSVGGGVSVCVSHVSSFISFSATAAAQSPDACSVCDCFGTVVDCSSKGELEYKQQQQHNNKKKKKSLG